MAQKEKKKNSVAYMVMSLAIAIVIWILSAYLSDNAASYTFGKLPLEYIGKSRLEANGLVIVSDEEQTNFKVTVSGKRDELARSFGKWSVTADVSEITAPGEYDIACEVSSPNSGLTVRNKNFDTVHVTAEEIAQKEVPVEIWSDEINGKLIKAQPDLKTVKVKGAKNEVEKVAAAYARLDGILLNGMGYDTPEQSVMLALYPADSAREPVPPPNSTLAFDVNQITVICTTYDLVTLPVKADISSADSDYVIDEERTRISPASATVGVLPGTNITNVRAEVKEITEEEAECELIEEEGMYIPESSKTVKVKLAVRK